MINKNTKMFLFMVTLLVLIVGLTAVTATDSNNQTNTATTPSVTPTTDTTVSTTSSLTTNTQNDVKDTTITKETTKTSTNNVKTSTPTTTKNTTSTTTKKAGSTTVSDYQGLYNAVETAKGSTDDSYTINLNPGTYLIDNPINWGNTTTTCKNLTIMGNDQTLNGQNMSNFITVHPGYVLNLDSIFVENARAHSFTSGIITNNNGTLSLNNFKINDNSLINLTTNTGSYIVSEGTLYINNMTIKNNSANISIIPVDYTLINLTTGNVEINNANIYNNTLIADGKLFGVSSKNATVNIKDSHVYNNVVIKDESKSLSDNTQTFFENNGLLNITNSSVVNNTQNGIYGRLVNNNLLYVNNVTVTNNYNITGILLNNGSAILNNTVFDKNYIMSNPESIQNFSVNGVIANMGNLTLNNSLISNTNLTTYFIVSKMGDNFIVDNSTFVNMTSTLGLISVNGSTNLNINNSKFINTSVGTYVLNTTASNNTISNNLFVNNTDNVHDMLFSPDMDGIFNKTLNVYNNVYVDNMLNDSMVNVSDVNVTDVINSYDFNATVNLRDVYNDTIRNGTVNVYINGVLYKGFNVTNGVAQITLPVTSLTFKNNITLQYNTLSKHYQNASTNFMLNIKLNTNTTVNPIIGVVGDVYEIQANVTDQNNKPVNGGTVIFKINNVTLKDENGNPIKVYVNNGTAKYNITLPAYFTKENMTITAIYGGTPHTYHQSISTPAKINVTKRNATITVITSPINNAEDKVVLLAVVADKLTNKTLNTGVVVFKYQGHTITDENGNPILVNVTNGQAKLEYTIPTGTSSHNYTITAVYSNRDYNRAENTTNQFINKTPTKITFNATENTPGSTPRTITLKGNITDLKNTQVVGTNKVCVKINGKTLTDNNNQTTYYNITNGNIDLNITTNYTGTIKNITIVAGERNGYDASTKTTTTNLTKTTKTTKTTIPANV